MYGPSLTTFRVSWHYSQSIPLCMVCFNSSTKYHVSAMRAMVQDAGTIVGNNKIYRIMPYRLYKSTVSSNSQKLDSLLFKSDISVSASNQNSLYRLY